MPVMRILKEGGMDDIDAETFPSEAEGPSLIFALLDCKNALPYMSDITLSICFVSPWEPEL